MKTKTILLTLIAGLIPFHSSFSGVPQLQPGDIDGCPNPMIAIRGKYNLAQDGLGALVSEIETKIDTNNDGLVCIPEVLRYDRSRLAVFGSMDINLDDCVSPNELKRFLQRSLEEAWIAEHQVMDVNKDGVVEIRELEIRYRNPPAGTLSPLEIISDYDANLDEKITRSEYVEQNIRLIKKLREQSPDFSGIETGALKPLGRIPRITTIPH